MQVLIIILFSRMRMIEAFIYCSNTECFACIDGYVLYKSSCMLSCPTGFQLMSGVCSPTNSQRIFSLDFTAVLNYNTNSIESFVTIDGEPFQNSARNSPVPTIDRGFFFETSSQMRASNTGWVFGPDMTISILLWPLVPGRIFRAITKNSSNIIAIAYSLNFGFEVEIWSLYDHYGQASTKVASSDISNIYVWTRIIISTSQIQDLFTVTIGGKSTTYSNLEFQYNASGVNYYLGSFEYGNSFSGFIMTMTADNEVIGDRYEIFNLILCPQYYYLTGSSCVESTSIVWPWNSNSDNNCYSSSCNACNGYSLKSCTQCSDGSMPTNNCETLKGCLDNNCDNCIFSYEQFSLKKVCGPSPTILPNSINIAIDIEFYGFSNSYSTFLTSSASNYPDTVKYRGIYFNGVSSYLISRNPLVLNSDFTVLAWIYCKNNIVFSDLPYLKLIGISEAEISLYSGQILKRFSVGYKQIGFFAWRFVSIKVKYIDGITAVTQYIDTVSQKVSTFDACAFVDDSISPILYLGRSNDEESYWKGFMYTYTIYQAYIDDITSRFNNTPLKFGGQSLWNADIMKFYDSNTDSYFYCQPSDIHGCSQLGTGNQCKSILCRECDDYYSDCIEDLNYDPCDAGYRIDTELKKCVKNNCEIYFGVGNYSCGSCLNGLFLLGTTCVKSCPLGFGNINQFCSSDNRAIIDIQFNTLLTKYESRRYLISFTRIENSGKSPIPTYNRGLYFTAPSMMSSSIFTSCYNFTMSFYLKLANPGIIIQKGNLIVTTTDSELHVSISSNSFEFYKPNHDWNFIVIKITIDFYRTLSVNYLAYKNSYIIKTKAFLLFEDAPSSLTIGDASGLGSTFQGFFYNLKFYQYATNPSASILMCSSSINFNCLWDCSINQFFCNGVCVDCTSTCNLGCRSAGGCGVCSSPLCVSCKDYDLCDECKANSVLQDNICTCSSGFEYNSSTTSCDYCGSDCSFSSSPDNSVCCVNSKVFSGSVCISCDSQCKTCSGPSKYECSSCSNFILVNSCMTSCPLGYFAPSKECKPLPAILPVLKYTFDTLQGMFIDSVQQVPAMHGSSVLFYPDYDQNDPIPVYNRGLYFNASGNYVYLPGDNRKLRIFGPTFYISIWLQPLSTSGTVIYKDHNRNSLLASYIEASKMNIKININHEVLIKSSSVLNQSSWNHVLIQIEYSSQLSLSFEINGIQSYITTAKTFAFLDNPDSLLYIGCNSNFDSCFKGYIYKFEIYIHKPPQSMNIFTNGCSGSCIICPDNGKCIPECRLTQFYNESTGLCNECPASCSSGCISNEKCSFCLDSNCKACKSYASNTCIECFENYELTESVCVKCNSSYYYNQSTKSCEKCSPLCLTCISNSVCASCVENSNIINNDCNCNPGFNRNNSNCDQILFNAFLKVSMNNEITLLFEKSVYEDSLISHVSVLVNQVSIEFSLVRITLSLYKIIINPPSVQEGDLLQVNFTNTIKSIDFCLLKPVILNASLHTSSNYILSQEINTIKVQAKTVMLGTVGAILGSSIIQFDPISTFNFLNNAEVYCLAAIYQVNIDQKLLGFLQAISIPSTIPNLLEYAVDQTHGVKVTGRLNDYGYTTNLFLLNSGFSIQIFLVLMMAMAILKLITYIKIEPVRKIARALLDKYYFRVFLRYWIQSFSDITVGSCITLSHFSLQNSLQYIDTIVSLIFMTFTSAMYFIVIFLLLKKSSVSTTDLEYFLKRFGTVFEEFKSEDSSTHFFYFFFATKRLVMIGLIFFVNDAFFQLLFTIICSLATIFYLLETRPCIDRAQGLYLTVNEAITFVYYFIMMLSMIPYFEITVRNPGGRCINAVLASLGLCILCNFYTTALKVANIIKSRLNRKKVGPINETIQRIETNSKDNVKKSLKYEEI